MFPAEFINEMTDTLGRERAQRMLSALAGEPEVSVRVNPFKRTVGALRAHFGELAGEPVPWAAGEAFYLSQRPSFTLDPLFHAGAYYVQEASSMYAGQLFDRAVSALESPAGLRVLDLCAAPGGKTTQLLSHAGPASLVVANEVMPARATVLAENVARWGCPGSVVTRSDPAAFASLHGFFDIVVADVPCSGEGMFRKDERAVAEWSPDAVRHCAARQRRILADVWPALAPGGFLLYSTCTFNRTEDEDNVDWIAAELGAEIVTHRHFYPGEDRGEGFFAALLRKNGSFSARSCAPSPADALTLIERRDLLKCFPTAFLKELQLLEKSLTVIASGTAVALRKGRDLVPDADLAMAVRRLPVAGLSFGTVPVSREEALRFLSKEPLVFSDHPRGWLLLEYEGLGIGFVKNLGNRSNNLLPAGRRIRCATR